ncbi:MAG: hypothetical protein ACI4I9_01655 [Porcipelethomonas sp.]
MNDAFVSDMKNFFGDVLMAASAVIVIYIICMIVKYAGSGKHKEARRSRQLCKELRACERIYKAELIDPGSGTSNDICDLYYCEDKIIIYFRRTGKMLEIVHDQVKHACAFAWDEVEKSYKSSNAAMIAGGLEFGFIGALAGASLPVEKKTTTRMRILVINYLDSSNSLKNIVFIIKASDIYADCFIDRLKKVCKTEN